ncbi:hypothetical protein [Sphingobacterium sp. LRF_L2]|uniref:hypothetical protein n=1 Tax=Sphingobacterium sp. LRF_L2 TaxID=3369421 RepID=UPI003F632D05
MFYHEYALPVLASLMGAEVRVFRQIIKTTVGLQVWEKGKGYFEVSTFSARQIEGNRFKSV